VPRPPEVTLAQARRLVPVVLGLLAFVVYAWCSAPGLYWLDSQELGASGVMWGSPHPTGFPLFCVLARAAAFFPFGELAWRVHMVSAACTAVAVGLTARLAAELAGDDASAIAAGAGAGVLLGASATVFRQATVTEVYAPTLLLLVLCAWLAVRAARSGDRRIGLAMSLVAGLGVTGVHASFRLLLALPVLALLAWKLRAGAKWVLAAPALASFAALAMLLYLPLRSASGHVAALDWGHPRTLGALWDHAITAARIRNAYADEMAATGAATLGHLRRFADLVEGDFGVIALVAAAAGVLVAAWVARPRFAVLLLACVGAGDFLYSVRLNPMGIAERQNGVPFAFALAVFAALGVVAAARRLGRAAPFAAAAFALIVAVPAAFGGLDTRAAVATSEAPRAWSELGLASAPSRSLALTQSDNTSSGTLWLTTVEAARPDVAVLVRQHLWDAVRVRDVLARAGSPLVGPVVAAALASRHALLWELGVDTLPDGAQLSYGVPFARLTRTPEGSVAVREVAGLARVFAEDDVCADENARAAHGSAWVSLGRQALLRRDPRAAAHAFEMASAADPRNAAALVNLGVLAAGRGELARAAAYADAALAIAPDTVNTLVNAARYRLALSEDARAHALAERAARLQPRNAAAWSLLGTLAARAHDVASARTFYERALAIDPSEPDARANLPRLGK
jgi:Tfp pilus assembly protein PilF